MKVTISLGLLVANEQAGVEIMWFETDLPCFPHKEMEFEHVMFNNAKKVIGVSYNMEAGTMNVALPDEKFPSREDRDKAVGYYLDNGWVKPHAS